MLATIAPAPVKNPNKTSVLGMNSVNIQQQNLQSGQQLQLNQNSGYNKKKFTYANMPFGQQPISVVRRNARERNRVKQVNNGFVTLRQHIPHNIIQALSNGGRGPHKKLSKVDTLRLAVEYIRRLQDLVSDLDIKKSSSSISTSSSTTNISEYSNSEFDHMLESPNSETSSYYTASPEPVLLQQQQQHNQHQIYSSHQQQNTSIDSQNNQSETSISPAPSYISEASSLSPSSMPNYGNFNGSSTSSNNNNSYGLNSTTTTTAIPNSITNLTPVITSVVTGTSLNYSINQFKFEPYDDYNSIHQDHHNHHHHNQHHTNNTIIVENATTSEDEELLDYISMWQEEQQ